MSEEKAREIIQNQQHRPPLILKDYAHGALVEKDMKFIVKQGKFSNTMKHKAKENFYYQH